MLQSLLPFTLFALVTSISPRPTNVLLLAHSARAGLRASVAPIVRDLNVFDGFVTVAASSVALLIYASASARSAPPTG